MKTVNTRTAFTLIELLVVITIIVVLLALLTPALDKAIYQAELTVCGANLHASAMSFTNYAMGNKRRFPHRPGMDGGQDGWSVSCLSPGTGAAQFYNMGQSASAEPADMRPMIRSYMSMNKQLNDPFVEQVNLDEAIPEVFIYASYHMFAGWKYVDAQFAGSGMTKLGDRIGWNGRRYSTMLADADHFNTGNYAMASHPDKDGILTLRTFQDQDSNTGDTATAAVTGAGLTLSWWDITVEVAEPRGYLDRNVAFIDMSVERYNDVEYIKNQTQPDERMDTVAWNRDANGFSGDWPSYGVQIPKR